MKIGEALKEEREALGLSKCKFSEGIIDRKFYGKVEEENRNIGSEALIKLLITHEIDIDNFFNKVKITYSSRKSVEKSNLNFEIEEAIKTKNISNLYKCADRIYELEGETPYWLRIQVFIFYLEKKQKKPSKTLLLKIKNELGKHDNIIDNGEAIKLFSNSLPILPFDQVDYYIKIIINKLKKKKLSSFKQERFAQVFSNYLRTCVERKINSDNIEFAFNYLNSITDKHLLIYRLYGLYDYNLLTKNFKKSEKIRKILDECGYSN